MEYEELKEYFDYSTWNKVETEHYICYSQKPLYMFFHKNREIELMITTAAGKGSIVATFPIEPENCNMFSDDIRMKAGNGCIQFPLPRDSQRIEREREEERL